MTFMYVTLLFQYHTGSIKSRAGAGRGAHGTTFQYHTGSIKRMEKDQNGKSRYSSRFNTTLVQLKVCSVCALHHDVYISFNTTLVQLKVMVREGGFVCPLWFQYHTGSIKRRSGRSSCGGISGSFNTTLVQLKGSARSDMVSISLSFNTTLVQLKGGHCGHRDRHLDSFNTTLVQLKVCALLRHRYYSIVRFNTTLVQLKGPETTRRKGGPNARFNTTLVQLKVPVPSTSRLLAHVSIPHWFN